MEHTTCREINLKNCVKNEKDAPALCSHTLGCSLIFWQRALGQRAFPPLTSGHIVQQVNGRHHPKHHLPHLWGSIAHVCKTGTAIQTADTIHYNDSTACIYCTSSDRGPGLLSLTKTNNSEILFIPRFLQVLWRCLNIFFLKRVNVFSSLKYIYREHTISLC